MNSLNVELLHAFSSYPVIIGGCILMTLCSFILMEQLVEEKRFNCIIAGILFGILNGVLASLLNAMEIHGNLIVALLITPLCPVLEFLIISKDRAYTYFFVYSMFLLHFCCLYNISSALIQLLLMNDSVEALSGSRYYRGTVYTATSILVMIILFYMAKAPMFPVKDLRSLIHDSRFSLMSFIYNTLASIMMLISSHIIVPFVNVTYPLYSGKFNFFLDMLIKMMIILGGCFIIVYMQCWQHHSRNIEMRLKDRLQTEKDFRQKTLNEGIASYSVNITQNRIIEGAENIKEPMSTLVDNYNMMIRTFAGFCVHNADWQVLYKLSDEGFYREKLDSGSVFNITFRCSPSGIQQIFELSKADSARISALETEKTWLWIDARCTVNIAPDTGDILCYMSFVDVDERVTKEQELQYAATTDPLTGIYNRKTAEQLIISFMKDKEKDGALFIIDLDYFKQVNDNLGHPAGDELLIETARLIQKEFRDYDIIGRLGGDEFFVYAVGLSNTDIIRERASSIEAGSQKTFEAENGTTVRTSVSIGIALFPEDSDNYDELYRHADAALYNAKNTGKGKYCFYSELEEK